MTERAEKTYLGLDIGTSSVKALLVDANQRIVAEASPSLGVSRPHPLWSEQDPDDWVRGVEVGVAAIRDHAPEAFGALAGIGLSGQMHGATLLDAADKPLRPAILWNDGRSFAECARTQAPRSRRGKNHWQPGDAGLHGAEDAVGRDARAGDRQGDEARAAAQGLRAPAPLGRGGIRNVRRLGNLVARRRQAALGRAPARGDRADARRHAAPGRGLRGFDVSRAIRRQGLGPGGSQDPDRRGRGRQCGLRHRRRRDRGRRGLRLARHLGRDLLGDRPLCQPARAHPARLLPRAAEPLARHVGDAVGGLLARLDRRYPWPRGRGRRAGRRGAELRAVEGGRRRSAGVPALSQRRAHAAQRRRGDGNVRRTYAPATAPTRWSSR